MTEHKYRRTTPSTEQGLCLECGKNKQRSKGGGKYGTLCFMCHNKRHGIPTNRNNKSYKKYRTKCCEKCGFTSDYICQFYVDHIDGNHRNNDPSNLMTLCSNCHRLKTYLNQDWK